MYQGLIMENKHIKKYSALPTMVSKSKCKCFLLCMWHPLLSDVGYQKPIMT